MNFTQKIIDISWPITCKMVEYKDRTSVDLAYTQTFKTSSARSSLITMSSHTGTHVDAPAHFLSNGKMLHDIALDRLVGKCIVFDCTDCKECITAQDLDRYQIEKGGIVLLKTANSSLPTEGEFYTNFVYLEESGARFLAEYGIKSVGIDYLGIERNQPGHETHKVLFEHEIPIIEGLRLAQVNAGFYMFYCLPLPVHGLEAAPARAILVENK